MHNIQTVLLKYHLTIKKLQCIEGETEGVRVKKQLINILSSIRNLTNHVSNTPERLLVCHVILIQGIIYFSQFPALL